jgi:hypothetical protein
LVLDVGTGKNRLRARDHQPDLASNLVAIFFEHYPIKPGARDEGFIDRVHGDRKRRERARIG